MRSSIWRNIFVQASYQLGLLTFLLKRGPEIFGCVDGSNHHFTLIFTAFVFCQVFNEFNAREIGDEFNPFKNLTKSPMFMLVILFTIIAQYVLVEYGGNFTQTTHLSIDEWKATFLLGAGSIPVGFLMRLIPVNEDLNSFAGDVGFLMQQKKQGSNKNNNMQNSVNFVKIMILPIAAAVVYKRTME